MRIALVNTTPKPAIYPVALLKIGAWRKGLGDECAIYSDRLPAAGAADEIWLTTCFTFDIPHALGMVREAKNRAERVKVGGVAATLLPEHFEREGAEVHRGLIPEAEAMRPDYSLLPSTPEYSITHTSRGCVRKCGFCMVHRLEPEFHSRDWEGDLHPAARRILFFDNNWLAKDGDDLRRDVATIKRLVKDGRIREVDFNQGIDCRLMTEDIAELLEGVPLRPVRFAFDGMQEDGHYQRAIEMMVRHGFTDFMPYVLYNFTDTPKDFYYRLRESVRLSTEHHVSIISFPMCYQPILEIDTGREYVGKHWTLQQKRAFAAIRGSESGPRGTVGGHAFNTLPPLQQFEYWYGKTADEFEAMLSYPKIRDLVGRKRGALRLSRAQRVTA